jgi:hypothetical protein
VTGKPRPPAGTKTAGKRLWTAILDAYDLDAAELVVLREMCRVTDRLDALDDAIRASGVVEGGRVSQVLTEARQQQQTWPSSPGRCGSRPTSRPRRRRMPPGPSLRPGGRGSVVARKRPADEPQTALQVLQQRMAAKRELLARISIAYDAGNMAEVDRLWAEVDTLYR